jgi:hypothetical protein
MTQAAENLTTPPDTRTDNGILAHVPGQYVGQAQISLPDAALVTGDEIRVEVDAGWLGRVRLTFRKYRYTRPAGKFSAVAWSSRHAERVVLPDQFPVGKTDPRHSGALAHRKSCPPTRSKWSP